MVIEDRLLPAAPHLTGAGARHVVEPVVAANGGELIDLRPGQVLYRPGRELVVSYAATVRWPAGEASETLLAGTTPDGAPEGTVPVEADGMEVGVWRYPFDPVLPGLADAVLPGPVARLLGRAADEVDLSVVSYRPVKRAVVRARWNGGEAYVKVLPPERVGPVIARHEALRAAAIPVPEVLAADEGRGLVAMRALGGTELREVLLAEAGALPAPEQLLAVVDAFAVAAVPPPDRPRPGLLDGARHHAAMVRRVAPAAASRLDELVAAIDAASRASRATTIHGDLHEAQLRIDGTGRIVGVLDVDDVGPGDPLDDPARAIAHLVALSIVHPPTAQRVRHHAAALHRAASARFDADALDVRIAAALAGLATGPFRVQDPDWPDGVDRLVGAAHAWGTGRGDETTLSAGSRPSHPGAGELTQR